MTSSDVLADKPDYTVQIFGAPYWQDQCPFGYTGAVTADQIAALCQSGHPSPWESLRGAFALIIEEGKTGTVWAATDRLGRIPVYFCTRDGHVHIGTSPEALTKADAPQLLAHQGLYHYIYFHMIPAPETAFRDVGKLRAAHSLQWQNGQLAVKRYWQPNFSAGRSAANLDTLAQDLKSTLRDATARAVAGESQVAAFLSGGLDSSTVAGLLAELQGGSAQAFAIGFDAPGYDEMPYARITAAHFGITLNEYYVTPDDIVRKLPELAAHCAEPFGNSSALPAWFCADAAARSGIKLMLAGDGGDELFAGNERYVKQNVFERYQRVPSALRALLEGVLTTLPSALPLISKARSYVAQANTPLPDRLQTYNFLHRHAPSELFRDEFLTQVQADLPQQRWREVYHEPAEAGRLDRMLYLDWQFTLADNDLRKVGEMCTAAGVAVRYPLLDDALVDLSLRIPDELKLRGERLRHFYKEALRGWLPDATIDKRKHGFGLPFGVWMREHPPLKELALDTLSALKSRPIFRSEFIDQAIAWQRSGHAAYYGELIWILVVLELWLQAHPHSLLEP